MIVKHFSQKHLIKIGCLSHSIFFACFFSLCLSAEVAREFRSIQSRSGQILVRWQDRFRVPPFLRQDEKAADIIVLSPELLAVSAERIKEKVLQQLGMSDRWRGQIRFFFASGKSETGHFRVDSQRFTNGWNYRITLSPKIERRVWLRGCVAVFLLEIANRMAGERSSEIPFWLIDGIVIELEQSSLIELSPNFADQIRIGTGNSKLGQVIPTQRHEDPFTATRAFLAQNVPMNISQLFIPTAADLSGKNAVLFNRSAHFFFRQILSLRAGKASLQHFLAALPNHLNWQQAFFQSFEEHFSTMLDLEKWWSLALTDLTWLAPLGSWSVSESLSYLDRILLPAALVGKARNQLPKRTHFTIQQVISEWDDADQRPTLENVSNQLRVLFVYASPRLRPLIKGYLETISSYILQREKVGYEPSRRGQTRLRAKPLINQIAKKLDAFDHQRDQQKASLRSSTNKEMSSQTFDSF